MIEKSIPITEDALEQAGFNHRGLNSRIITEYWKTYNPNAKSEKQALDWSVRVRFRERKDAAYSVWLVFPDYMYELDVTTMQEINILLSLLKRKNNAAGNDRHWQ